MIYNFTIKDLQHGPNILPIMLALCSMLSGTYYAQNYAGESLTADLINLQDYKPQEPQNTLEAKIIHNSDHLEDVS